MPALVTEHGIMLIHSTKHLLGEILPQFPEKHPAAEIAKDLLERVLRSGTSDTVVMLSGKHAVFIAEILKPWAEKSAVIRGPALRIDLGIMLLKDLAAYMDIKFTRSAAQAGPGDFVKDKLGFLHEIKENTAFGASHPRNWTIKDIDGEALTMWDAARYYKAEDLPPGTKHRVLWPPHVE